MNTPTTPNEPKGGDRLNVTRRRLFRGAAAGVGVTLAVQAKTALGSAVCQSPSSQMSGNLSRPLNNGQCSGGRSPGFWKVPQHFSYWGPAGATPATFKAPVSECASGLKGLKYGDIATHGTLLTSVGFVGAPADVGLWAVLAFPGEFSGGQLMRHLAAAWLNAGYFVGGSARYPLTQAQVIEMWNATKAGGLYCPASMLGCGASGWNADQVIAYIEGMYDLNSEVEPNLCKTSL